MSRQSAYTPELGESINQQIAQGKPLVRVCEEKGLGYSTVRRWLKEHEQFAHAHAQARIDHAEHLFDEIITISDTPTYGVTRVIKPDGTVEEREGDMLGHRTLQINSRKWTLEKLDPARFGDKLNVEHSGSIDVNIREMGREDLILELQALALKGVPVPDTLLSAPIEDAEFEDIPDDDWSDLA